MILSSTFPRWINDTEPPFVYELSKRIAEKFDCIILAPHTLNAKKNEQIGNLYVKRYQYLPESLQRLAYNGGIVPNLKRNRLLYFQIPFFLLSQLFSTIQLLRNNTTDLIHAHWLIPQGFIAVLARLITRTDTPILCTLHGGDLYSFNNFIIRYLKIFILKRTDIISVVSNAMKRDVIQLGIDKAKIHVIPMGVDALNIFKPIETIKRKNNTILYVGRLVEKKGVKFLIYAMEQVINVIPNASLYIVGSGPDHKYLQSTALKIGVSDNVHFLGPLHNSELPLLYNEHSTVAFPSIIAQSGDKEGFGLVLTEALSCECAIVASNLPSVTDIISDNFNALMVEPKDIQALSNAMIKLLKDKSLANKLGQNGRKFVLDNFDWEIISSKYIKLISSYAN